MTLCYKCGEPAPYACDAIEPGSDKKCGKTCCEDHALPRVAGAEDIGKNTLCLDHAHLQKARKGAVAAVIARNVVPPLSPAERFNEAGGFAPLEIDGRIYQVCYDFNAIAAAEEACKCNNLLQGMGLLLVKGYNASQLRGLFYAALQRAHPGTTVEAAGALVRIDTITDIRNAILSAYNLSIPEKNRFTLRPQEAGEGTGLAPDENKNPSPVDNSGSSTGLSDAVNLD